MLRVDIQHISKAFASKVVFDQLDWQLEAGKSYALLGVNGAGKTTLMRCICGILQPDTGVIVNSGGHRALGYLPEERGLYKKMSVQEQLLFFGKLRGMEHRQALHAIEYWLTLFELGARAHDPLHTLSKGNQQKVQFIAAVLHNPTLLVLDEPFSGFDPVVSAQVVTEIRKLQHRGATVIYSTHRMDTVETLCDELALLHQGKFRIQGTVFQIKKQFFNQSYVVHLATPPIDAPSQYIQKQDYVEIEIQGDIKYAQHWLHQWSANNIVLKFAPQYPSLDHIFATLTQSTQ